MNISKRLKCRQVYQSSGIKFRRKLREVSRYLNKTRWSWCGAHPWAIFVKGEDNA